MASLSRAASFIAWYRTLWARRSSSDFIASGSGRCALILGRDSGAGGRAVDCSGLENRRTRKRSGGSNPSLPATKLSCQPERSTLVFHPQTWGTRMLLRQLQKLVSAVAMVALMAWLGAALPARADAPKPETWAHFTSCLWLLLHDGASHEQECDPSRIGTPPASPSGGSGAADNGGSPTCCPCSVDNVVIPGRPTPDCCPCTG